MLTKTFDLPNGQKFRMGQCKFMRVREPIHNLEGYVCIESVLYPEYVGCFFMFAGFPNKNGVDIDSTLDMELVA